MFEHINSYLKRKLFMVHHYAYSLIERTVWGGEFREFILIKLLEKYYGALFRRTWVFNRTPPHFYNHRIGIFRFAYGQGPSLGPYSYYRGFFNSEVIREGDKLLDIGCGDGFFTKRFFSAKCSRVDAIDLDKEAIRMAMKYSGSPNILYYTLDAVGNPFPGDSYDVIVWDGAIGHFSAEDSSKVLKKICNALTQEGIFLGSESLGREEGGYDHHQFFSLDDLYALFKPYFRYMQMRSVDYKIGWHGHLIRTEAYWRCSNSPVRLSAPGWHSYS